MEIHGEELHRSLTAQARTAHSSSVTQHGSTEESQGIRNRHHDVPTATKQKLPPEKLAMVETRLGHRYLFRRPRALQYTFQSKVLQAGDEPLGGEHSLQHAESNGDHHGPDARELIARSRERLDLFMAILLFALAFMPSWRIWNGIRGFLNNYHMDDVTQRFFIFWLLFLSVLFGNNIAYLPDDQQVAKTYSISIYLIIRASLSIAEVFNSFFIPWVRKMALLQFILTLPGVGLWIWSIYVGGNTVIGTILGATVADYLAPLLVESSLAQRFIGSEYGKALDPHHFTSRMGSFFIITLGEGVLQLIKGGPLKLGLNGATGLSAWTLAIYFLLAYLYSNKDYSRAYIPAVVRGGWRTQLWLILHIPIFMSILTLSASLMFIIGESAGTEDIPSKEQDSYVQSAIWTVGSSLGFSLASMTGLALLDENLDPPGTLRVDNRLVRLSGRVVYIIVILLVPIKSDLNPQVYLGICSLLMWALQMWEYAVSLEKDFKVVEPKGLTTMIRHAHSNPEGGVGASFLPSHSQMPRGEKSRADQPK